jgi:putative PEP-CTERM system histidine kinase
VNPALIGNGLASAVFAMLGVASLTRWRRGLGGLWLTPALFASAAWAALEVAARSGLIHGGELAGAVRLGFWLIVLGKQVPPAGDSLLTFVRRAAFLALPVVLALDAIAAVLGDLGFSVTLLARTLVVTGMLQALLGLVLVEQALRNCAIADRWALKYVLLGAGTFLTFDLIYYACAYLRLDTVLALADARGGANLLAALVLTIGLRRLSMHRPAPPASQGVLFYTGSLVAIGSYLAVVAFAAFYVRVAGGTAGAVFEALVLTGGVFLLVALLFSEQVRAVARVIVAKAFSPYRYDYRAEWLRLTDALAAGDEAGPLAERALRAVTGIVHSASGGLWLRQYGGPYIPVAGDLATAADNIVPSGAPWLGYLEAHEWVLDLNSPLPAAIAASDIPPWLSGNSSAWLVVPLLRGDTLEAFAVVGRPLTPSAALSWEDLDLLRTAGRQVAAFLALERIAQRLAQARQFEAYNRIATFMMHDLKNVAAQLFLVVRNAEVHRRNPQFVDDVIATVDNAAHRMQRVVDQLRRQPDSLDVRRVDVTVLCQDIVARCASRAPVPALTAHAPSLVVTVDSAGLANVLEHVVRNAQDATPESGRVAIDIRDAGEEVVIDVSDTGCGMDAQFVRDRLFRPFYSTRGSQGMGIGAFQAREFVMAAGGAVEVKSVPGAGTLFRIHLPRAPAR